MQALLNSTLALQTSQATAAATVINVLASLVAATATSGQLSSSLVLEALGIHPSYALTGPQLAFESCVLPRAAANGLAFEFTIATYADTGNNSGDLGNSSAAADTAVRRLLAAAGHVVSGGVARAGALLVDPWDGYLLSAGQQFEQQVAGLDVKMPRYIGTDGHNKVMAGLLLHVQRKPLLPTAGGSLDLEASQVRAVRAARPPPP